MKRIAIAVSLVVLSFAVSVWAQTAAPTPNPELKKFDVLLGHWTYEEAYLAGPLGPASKVTGELTVNRFLGGFFFEGQATEKGATGESRILEIIGYDPANKSFFSNEYHDDGTMLSGAYVFNENTFTYAGKSVGGPMLRATMIIAADLMSITGKGEISTDGKAWTPFFDGKWTKAKSVPKK
jgi:hypothetical protein